MLFHTISGFSQEIFATIQEGNIEKVKALLKTNPNLLNSTKENGDTPLHFAAFAGHKDIVQYLLAQNAQIDRTNKGNATALIYAVYFGHKEVAEVLLAKGAECNSADLSGRTSLHYAASSGRLDIVQLLLEKDAETDIRASGYFGRTALQLALQNDHLDVATYLIEKGADINQTEEAYGWSSLYWSLRREQTEMAKQLISLGAEIHLTDYDGITPIRMAVEYGYEDVISLLQKKGAALTELDKHSMRTLLHSAAINGYLNIADLLIRDGADINAKDKNGKTPLFYANKYGHYKTADLLIKHGAESDSVEKKNKTEHLDKQLKEREAIVWYLGHCGWAVKTKNYFLIFDYWQYGEKPDEPGILNGHINPNEIRDAQVYVFVSHEHYDHFDQIIFEWKKTMKNINYIFGWQMENGQDYIYINPGEPTKIGELDIITRLTRNGVSNQGFLVKVDGIVIYHSGDDNNNDDIDLLIPDFKSLDFLFQTITHNEGEGALFRINKFAPKAMFPMHYGGREYRYEEFADFASEKIANVNIICAENRGDRFFFRDDHVLNE
jgi:ankyrin repeat protein